jgi:hypothetical protein
VSYNKVKGIKQKQEENPEIPRWWLQGGAESVPPKVKSWRDTGDTPYRKNH